VEDTLEEESSHDNFRIALYYCYVPIENVEEHMEFQNSISIANNLHGRIRVASEGLNGVLSGRREHLENYERLLNKELLRHDHAFELDVKLCQLRTDLPVKVQLFDSIGVKKTGHVVCLVEKEELQRHGKGKSRKSKRKQRQREETSQQDAAVIEEVWSKCQTSLDTTAKGAAHLSPAEWDQKLETLSDQPDNSIVLLDCRNFYESNIGYFSKPNTTTVLTNTRKYSELPELFVQQADRLASSSHIFMYCTGGVRCERASLFLQKLMDEQEKQPKEIYQLHGGIQRYLEQPSSSLFHGKNFVFDQRRHDPVVQEKNEVVGQCILCDKAHDDYDNGHAPVEGREARCCHCRILILVCNDCRQVVSCWGEETSLPPVYCGGLDACLQKPPWKELEGNSQSVKEDAVAS
jgi:predicted sulfurtransferase